MTFFTGPGGMFVSSTQRNVEAIREKLAVAEAAVGRAQHDLADVAFACALSDDYGPATALQAKLDAARSRVSVLHQAYSVAEAAEQQRLAEARNKELKSRSRAVRQHAAALNKAVESYEAAAAAQRKAWDKITTAAAPLRAVLGDIHLSYPELGERRLLDLAEREIARVGYEHGHNGAFPAAPGASAAILSPDNSRSRVRRAAGAA